MSVISDVHQFQPLNKDSKPLSGQRLARLIAKKNRNDEYESAHLTQSMCVSVPMIGYDEIGEQIEQLMPHIQGMLEDAQDACIREFRLQHGRDEIPQDAISIQAIVTYLEESSKGSRITKEWMQSWFIESYGDAASQFIRNAIDGAADEIIQSKVAVIRDMFAGFASARYSPEIPKLKAMIRFISYIGPDNCDARMTAIGRKCTQILAIKEAEMASDALGF